MNSGAIITIVIATSIIGYSIYAIVRNIKKQIKGECTGCSGDCSACNIEKPSIK